MPPRGIKKGTKRARQYEHIKQTTFSYNIAPLIAAFVPGRGGVSEDEVTEWLNDLAELQHQGRYFFSVNRYLFAASRPQGGGPRSATGL
jgi:hypothetical protein